tara:strand:- start:471 stop:656 length:186 start_codon:yes stop_codon:yes gene_type:complete
MELIKNNTYNFKNIVNRKEKFLSSDSNVNFNYLYPKGHLITHQMRWFRDILSKGPNPFMPL